MILLSPPLPSVSTGPIHDLESMLQRYMQPWRPRKTSIHFTATVTLTKKQRYHHQVLTDRPHFDPPHSDQIAHIGIVDDTDDLKYHWGRERLYATNRRLSENEVDGLGVASDIGGVAGQASSGNKRAGLPKSPEVGMSSRCLMWGTNCTGRHVAASIAILVHLLSR